jgi:peptide chain release factor 2
LLEKEVNSINFWNDQVHAKEVIEELNDLKKVTADVISIRNEITDLLEFKDDDDFSSLFNIKDIDKRVSKLENAVLLSGDFDKDSCVLEIHSGAGGTEACDWASMLLRMYKRWAMAKGYSIEVLDYLDGDEAGVKKVSLSIKGKYAYGYLKAEKGVHRLVRLSPFDSNNKRHTSFASVEVIPELNRDIDLEIKEDDLKIDVFRSSGAGGQGVNTTDSAVRITHLPTNTVVTCQNERSQIKNKEKALNVLKSRLLFLEVEAKRKELENIKGETENIDFGSQIRSYVMHPYSMVKDHRTGIEVGNVNKVLDGDLDVFIDGYLRS